MVRGGATLPFFDSTFHFSPMPCKQKSYSFLSADKNFTKYQALWKAVSVALTKLELFISALEFIYSLSK